MTLRYLQEYEAMQTVCSIFISCYHLQHHICLHCTPFAYHFFNDAQPKTVRQNNMITLTAARIASNTQLEVFLKVKQASNVDFSFLNPTDELYEYYLYLKGKHCNTTSNTKNDSGDNKKGGNDSDASDNPLSGLLGGYASSSSDEEEGMKTLEEKKDTCSNNNEDNCPTGAQKPGGTSDDEQEDRKRKADRLKRLKAWKESRLKQGL